ncbi:MAG: PAS domain-containing protein [Acidobacteria bacterium]|nr:PAS domain-containing protein [Acidobacteriota bacterium]
MDHGEIERIDRITRLLHELLAGGNPERIPLDGDPGDEIRQAGEAANRLADELERAAAAAAGLAEGQLGEEIPRSLSVINGLKSVQSILRHLNWLTARVAGGDFRQRADFMGDFSHSFNWMVERLDADQRVLRELNRFLDTVTQAVPDALLVVDRDYRIVLANQSLLELAGVADPVAAGLHCYEVLREMPAPGAEGGKACLCARVFASKEPVRSWQVPCRLVTAERVLDLAASPVLAEDGEVGQVVLICRDASERLKFEARLFETRKAQSLNVMAGSIAHHFNNLLTVVLGYQAMVLPALPRESKAAAQIEAAQRVAQQAAELSALMRTYVGQDRKKIEALDLSALVREAAALLEPAECEGIEFRYRLAPGLPAVPGDAQQIRQAVAAVIRNSVEAVQPGTGILDLATERRTCTLAELRDLPLYEGQPAGDYVSVEVRDNGAGMDAETARRTFEPFFTTKFTGRGLGLALVHGILRGHKGIASLETASGQGTTVRLLFPVSPA